MDDTELVYSGAFRPLGVERIGPDLVKRIGVLADVEKEGEIQVRGETIDLKDGDLVEITIRESTDEILDMKNLGCYTEMN